ncbi:Fc.00g008640.m01.CDS01 [Cosmosporella sp. VM-42]
MVYKGQEANKQPDRQGNRRRPFSTWVKKLTNFKNSSDGDQKKRNKKRGLKKNHPYPESGVVGNGVTNGTSACTFSTAQSGSNTSVERSVRASTEGQAPPTSGNRSVVGTVATDHEGSHSIKAPSHGTSSLAGTSRTVGGGIESRRGGDSTFSSPAPSVRSLTTTLTTIQSMAPNGNGHGNGTTSTPTQSNTQSIQFSQPFPSTAPVSAIPAHLAPSGNPTTYNAATANNLLTDNASILTLASSSKRRRRRSLDTDASVRALAPSSLWGGSRESLPLSVLSANIESSGMPPTPGLHGSSSRMGAERTSIYSATGVPPAMAGDRSSYYARQGDGASVRSGFPGHGRADSVSGSIGGLSSPLVSPREAHEKAEKEENSTPATKEE